eukprot:1135267_1
MGRNHAPMCHDTWTHVQLHIITHGPIYNSTWSHPTSTHSCIMFQIFTISCFNHSSILLIQQSNKSITQKYQFIHSFILLRWLSDAAVHLHSLNFIHSSIHVFSSVFVLVF